MSSKNAKKSEQRKSSQGQDSAQTSQSKQHNQPPAQGEQPQPTQTQNQPLPPQTTLPQEQVQQPPQQVEPPQTQSAQQPQPAAVPPQVLQNQTQYQYVYVNYSRKSNVIGLSIVYAVGLFLAIGFPISFFSMNGSIKDFSNETDYYLIQVVKVVMPIVLSMSVISSIILWIVYLSSKNKTVAKIAAACTLSISVISFVVFWIYLNFYSVVGFGDAAFFLPMPFGVMILGIAWCVNVFKYHNEKPAYFANNSLNGQYVVSPQYPNQPPQYQYSSQPSVQYPPQQPVQYYQQQPQATYSPAPQQYPQNTAQYPYDYNKK